MKPETRWCIYHPDDGFMQPFGDSAREVADECHSSNIMEKPGHVCVEVTITPTGKPPLTPDQIYGN